MASPSSGVGSERGNSHDAFLGGGAAVMSPCYPRRPGGIFGRGSPTPRSAPTLYGSWCARHIDSLQPAQMALCPKKPPIAYQALAPRHDQTGHRPIAGQSRIGNNPGDVVIIDQENIEGSVIKSTTPSPSRTRCARAIHRVRSGRFSASAPVGVGRRRR